MTKPVQLRCLVGKPFDICFMLSMPYHSFHFLGDSPPQFTLRFRGVMELSEQHLLTSVATKRLRLLFPNDLLIILIASDNTN